MGADEYVLRLLGTDGLILISSSLTSWTAGKGTAGDEWRGEGGAPRGGGGAPRGEGGPRRGEVDPRRGDVGAPIDNEDDVEDEEDEEDEDDSDEDGRRSALILGMELKEKSAGVDEDVEVVVLPLSRLMVSREWTARR